MEEGTLFGMELPLIVPVVLKVATTRFSFATVNLALALGVIRSEGATMMTLLEWMSVLREPVILHSSMS